MKKDTIFNLTDDELALAKSKNSDINKLGFAILLKYFQLENHYPKHIKFIDPLMLNTIANQLNISALTINQFDWEGRSTKRFRQEIRELLGYRKATLSDISDLKIWLTKNVFNNAFKRSQRVEYAYTYFCENKIEPFTSKELEKHVNSAHYEFEKQLFNSIYCELTDKSKFLMDDLLKESCDEDDESINNEERDESKIKFQHLKKDIPGAKLKNISHAIQKIHCLKQLILPENLLCDFSAKLIKKYYQRVMAERPSGMRVLRITTPQYTVYLKQTPPDLFIEVDIIQKCRELCEITDIPEVIAVNKNLHCFLMKECGDASLRTVFDGHLNVDLLVQGLQVYKKCSKATAHMWMPFFKLVYLIGALSIFQNYTKTSSTMKNF